MEEDRNELISTEQLIGRSLDNGVDLGSNPHHTINKYIEMGLIPRLINGLHPATAVDRLVAIDKMLKKGTGLEEIRDMIRKERREYLEKGGDLSSLVGVYKKTAFKSLLMLVSLTVIMVFSYSLFTATPPTTLAANIAKGVAKPVGRTLAAVIRQAKDEGDNSTDPLGLTNISKIITINDKQEIVIEKNIIGPTTEIVATNINADKVDGADAGTEGGNVLLLDENGDIDISGNVIATTFTGSGKGLTDVPVESISGVLANINLPSGIDATKILGAMTNATLAWGLVTSRPTVLSSVDGVSNNLGNVDFVAGAGVTITPNNSANTITFNLSGSGVNADLLDSLDSTAFLRSNTSDSFTSGTLTIGVGATLSVAGSFSCTNCVGDAAVVDTITASNYLPLAGGTMAGDINMNNNLITNIGNASTDFTAAGGLNIADGLDVEGYGAFGSDAGIGTEVILNVQETFTTDETPTGIYVLTTSTYPSGPGNPDVEGIVSIGLFSGEDTGFQATGIRTFGFFNSTTGTPTGGTLTGLETYWSTAGATVGSITDAHSIDIRDISCCAGPIDPTNSYGIRIRNQGNAGITSTYGLYIANQTGASTNYAIYQTGTGGTNYFNATSAFGRTATGNDTSYAAVFQGAICVDDSTANCPAGPTSGAIYVENSVGAGNVSAFDISEYYPATEPTEKGDLVAAAGDSSVEISSGAYDPNIVGIVSTNPAIVIDKTSITFGKTAGDRFDPRNPYVALAGRVPVKITTENGAIAPGDPLTSSSTPGVAMKATKSGPIVGKALETYSGPPAGGGTGKIMVFVSVGWYVAPGIGGQDLNLGNSTSIDTDTLSANTVNTQVLIVGNRKLSINAGGALNVDGDLEVDGNLIVAGKIKAAEIEVGKVNVGTDNPPTTSAGTAVLQAGQTKAVVETTKVTADSLIFVTPTTLTDKVLSVTSKKEGESFTVQVKTASTEKVEFNWWVVN